MTPVISKACRLVCFSFFPHPLELKMLNTAKIIAKLLGLAAAGLLTLSAHAQTLGTFIATGNPTAPRVGHTATLLNDGRVLIAGGGHPVSRPAAVLNSTILSPGHSRLPEA